MKQGPPRTGFTLIELMLVVAIISLLASIAIPKFANLVVKSKEASVKGILGSIRSAISIYYANNEGYFPVTDSAGLTALTIASSYLDYVPAIAIPAPAEHPSSDGVHDTINDADDFVNSRIYFWKGSPPPPSGLGAPPPPATWFGAMELIEEGTFKIMCSHTNLAGKPWSDE